MSKRTLARLRTRIDALDAKLVKILDERARAARCIGKIKQKRQQNTYDPEREQAVLKRITRLGRGDFPAVAIRNVYREVLSACRALQSPLQVAYLGPSATFTHAAALKHFGQSMPMTPAATIGGVFAAVESGAAQYGVVPVENSTEGAVTHTFDRLLESPLVICGEVMLPISHCLLGQGSKTKPKKIYSHSQATAQCREWLEKNYPGVPLSEVSSTARAAQLAGEDAQTLAIGSELAAREYGLKVLKRQIEDHHHNITRFLILGTAAPKATGHDKTSLAFSVNDEPGILSRMLIPFAEQGINLSKIESRPMVRLAVSRGKTLQKRRHWEYVFFLDLEGPIGSSKVARAVGALEKKCLFLKVLGSYPRSKE